MIRLALATDEAAIRDCATRAYARYIPLIGRRPAPIEADFATQIASGQVYVATGAAGDVLGYIVFHPEEDAILLESVAVLPAAAGCGIGKALIRFCEEMAHQQGFCRVRLYTNAKMLENLAIYPRLGYVQVDRLTEDGFDRVFFEKRLDWP